MDSMRRRVVMAGVTAPSLLLPGQRVRFMRIDSDEFAGLASRRRQRNVT